MDISTSVTSDVASELKTSTVQVVHDVPGCYRCLSCKSFFDSIDQLLLHNVDCHQQTYPTPDIVSSTSAAVDKTESELPGFGNKCVVCGVVIEPWIRLRKHMTSHDPAPPDPTFFDNCRMADGTIQCLICGVKRPSMVYLRRHYAFHTNARNFSCPKCPRSYKKSPGLVAHFKRAHTTLARTYNCNECDFTTTYGHLLHRHRLKHAGITQRERCEVCFKIVPKGRLLYHYHQHTDEKPYECQQCNSRFIIPSLLKRHVKSMHESGKCASDHTGLKRRPAQPCTEAPSDVSLPGLDNQCIVCGKRFPLWHLLRGHMRTHDSAPREATLLDNCRLADGTIHCLICGKIQENISRLRRHFQCHTHVRRFSCPKCPRTYKASKVFLRHFKIAHTTLAHTYKCDQCDFTTPYPASFRRHVSIHAGIFERERCEVCFNMFSKGSIKNHYFLHTGERPYHCSLCDKSYSTVQMLRNHTAFIHFGKKRKYEREDCLVCGKRTRPENFECHMRRHTDEPTNICCVCGKRFYSLKRYLFHMERVHIRVKDRKCPVCEKAFYGLSEVHQHMMVHVDEKLFKCEVCGKAFKWKHKIGDHMKTHSEERPFKCDLCGEAFKWKHNLANHARAKHK